MVQLLDIDQIPAPNTDHLVIEDDTPVDNFQSAKQQRLLVDSLYSSQMLPAPFVADANVGIFGSIVQEGVAPDVFVSLGVKMPGDWSQRENRTYFVWQFGKLPEVVIEIVSNKKGNELVAKEPGKLSKKESYAQMGIAYYVVFDPLQQLQEPEQMNGQLLKVFVLTGRHYTELPTPFWLEDVGLGLTLWEGEFEQVLGVWLRWCDRAGQVISTGAEDRNLERQRADAEKERADAEKERADAEKGRAEAAEAKTRLLADRLRAMGINPEEM
jgi:Uma2 family endonuclease